MSYQAAEALRKTLSDIGIKETWITQGGVSIQCAKHEVKKTLRIINSLKNSLKVVELSLSVRNKKGIFERRQFKRLEGKVIELASEKQD